MKKISAVLVAFMAFAFTGCVPAGAEGQAAGGPESLLLYAGVMVVFFVAMYFLTIRPEKKRQKEQQAMLDAMAVGDTVLTTSGFYGVVIDITSDTVIVEFGNNKNCRIPMQKSAIVQSEHPEGYVAPTPVETENNKEKK